jgi:hypothetical protein
MRGWLAVVSVVALAVSGCAASGGPPDTAVPGRSALPAPPQRFSVIRPAQVLSAATIGAGAEVPVRVTARDGLPAAGVSAVAVHISVRASARPRPGLTPHGTLEVAPWTPASPAAGGMEPGRARAPAASSPHLLAYQGGSTADGFALVGVGPGGVLSLSNQGNAPVSVSVDVQGFATGPGSAAGHGVVVPLAAPAAVATQAALRPGQAVSWPVTGHGVPGGGVAGLLVDLTVLAPGAGKLSEAGSAALVDYTPGATVSGLALVRDDAGKIGLRNDSAGAAAVSATVVGYLSSRPVADGGNLVTAAPAPLTTAPVRVPPGGLVSVPVAGLGAVPPAGAVGVAVGITATAASGARVAGDVSVGVGTADPTAAASITCPASAAPCTAFTVARLASPRSGGVLDVRNHSAFGVLVSLDSYGYLAGRTAPAAPAGVTASARRDSAVVTWRAPAADGGAGISGYAVTVSPGGRRLSVTGRATHLVVPGVRAGAGYTFTVAARNADGRGPAAVARLIPAGTPGTPGRVLVQGDGSGRVLATWAPPAPRGALTRYVVTASPGRARVAVPPGGTSAVLDGVAPGGVYLVCVTASGRSGTSAQACAAPWHAVAAGPPLRPLGRATVPGPPRSVRAVAGNARVTVSWAVPATAGASALTGYTVTASPGGATASAPASATSATVPGLTNGVAYTFAVRAVSRAGPSAPATAEAAVTAASVPGAPTGVTATAGNAQATVTWTAPSSNGGSALTGYTVTASPGGQSATASGSVTSALVTGLTNGTSYTFTVTATNAAGTGPASAASKAVTPSGPPGAPTGVKATAGNKQAKVTWTAPAATGGGAISSYTVAASPGTATATVAGTVKTATVTGLTNGTTYTFTVTAATAGGPGPASAPSGAITPEAPPGAPTGVTATAGNAQATVSWTPPSANGGDPITKYTVTASDGTTATAAATATSVTVTGLTNGTTYTFTVKASNAIGASPASAASNAVTPAGPPYAPVITSLVPGNGQATLTWSAPGDGGEPITGYTLTVEPGGATYSAAATATSATVTGLTNGTAYTIAVTATSSLGTGAAATAGPVTPVTAPGAPADVTATASQASATVSWSPPSTEGSAVTGYTVTASPGGQATTVSGLTTAATITGLTDGTAYTFTVTATDPSGTGPASSPSSPVTPGPVPGPPTDVQATAGNAAAAVSWAAPASAGGSAISGYTVTAVPGGATATVAATATTASVTGLTNGTAYRFTVVATNSYGNSAPSASSAPLTPAAPAAPDAPFITNVTAEDSAVAVTWVPPDTGTASLTGYVLTTTSGGTTVATADEPPAATQATVTGLADGTDYTFTVAAVNGNGTSPASPPSVPVAPRPPTAPMAPANLIVAPQNGQIQVGWVAPSDGGSAITGYTVSVSPAGVAPVTTAAGTTVVTVTGLANGTAYTVSVTATNAAGTSPAAQAGPATPEPSIAPGAPANVTASATGSGSVALTWTPPMDPGTSAVSGYKVSASTGGAVAATQSASATACSGSPVLCTASMTGLTATAAYTFAVTATSADGTGPASTATDPVTPDVVVSQAPVVLSSASLATLRYVETDGSLVFEQPPAQVTGLAAGDLVQVPPTSAAPHGALAEVQSVTTQGGFVVVATSAATLNDEYSTYDTSLNLPFNSADATLSGAAPGVSLSRPTLRGQVLGGRGAQGVAVPADGAPPISWSDGSLTLTVDHDLLPGDSEEGGDETVSAGPVASLDGSVTLTPIMHGSFTGGAADFEVGGEIKADLTAEFGVHLGTTSRIFLAEVDVPDIAVTELGPVGAVFQVYAVLDTDGSVGVSFEASYDHTLGAQCQISTALGGNDTCSGVDQDNAHGGGLEGSASIYGEMSIDAGLEMDAGLEIWDLIAPEVTLTPELEFDASTTDDPWWSLDFGGNLGIAIKPCFIFCAGTPLYENSDLVSIGLLTLADAGGPFSGLVVTPSVANPGAGQSIGFQAQTPAGQISTSDVTWSVVAGPGTISSSGTYESDQAGTAVVEADYDGLTARAGVVVGPVLTGPQQDESKGLVDAAMASWPAPGTGVVTPDSYEVTAQAEGPVPSGGKASESVGVPAPETFAYLPGLSPGVDYSLTVYAIGADGHAVAGPPVDVEPLSAMPSVLSGRQFHGDVALADDEQPDNTGTAGYGGAVVSGSGQYVFFYTEARSNIAGSVASVWDPTSEDLYLVREDLLTGQYAAASVGPDGHTPVPVTSSGDILPDMFPFDPGDGSLVTNYSGDAVAFTELGPDGEAGTQLVYNFVTQSTWTVGSGFGLAGLSDDGTVVTSDQYNPDSSGNAETIYRQTSGAGTTAISGCPAAPGDDCEGYISDISMSGDGNLIAFDGEGVDDTSTVYIYNASSGQITNLLGADNQDQDGVEAYYPLISGDGSVIAADYFSDSGQDGILLDRISNVEGSGSPSVIAGTDSSYSFPASLSYHGDVLAYLQWSQNTDANQDGVLKVYENGSSAQVPESADTDPNSVDVADGRTPLVIFTAIVTPDGGLNADDPYPGVFEWQAGG